MNSKKVDRIHYGDLIIKWNVDWRYYNNDNDNCGKKPIVAWNMASFLVVKIFQTLEVEDKSKSLFNINIK